ncbi:MAG: restriction endonuclease subunit S [Actinomycetota bacterium]|nr:restriction endonuclease subunit S [Actinomycetota bacterium]
MSTVDKLTVEEQVPVRLCNYTDVYAGDDIRDDRPFMTATATAEQFRRFRLRVGQTLITKDSETADDIGTPAYVAESAPDLICGYHVAMLTPRSSEVHPRYLYWAVSSDYCREQLSAAALGVTRFGLRLDAIEGLTILLPPLDEQRRILEYLDRETGRIDEVVAMREAMVDALTARQSASLEALVLGLGRVGSPSRAPYFESVPDGWRETRLGHLDCRVQTGPFGSQLHANEYVEGGWPFVNPANLRGGEIRADPKMTVSDDKRSELARHVLAVGDIVFGRRGEMGRAGLVTEVEDGWLCGTGSLRLRLLDERLVPAYLKLLLETRAVRSYFELNSIGSTMDNLNTTIVLAVPVLVPPVEEQHAIVAEVREHAARTSRLVRRLLHQATLLREHRQAIIASAIAGEREAA